jgi:Enoyl-CoA hydratase/isomerase
LARVLALPMPTVAAVTGHAFGAGAMLATAHDWRVRRADRGYYCFPEVDIRIPFIPGMAALVQAKPTPAAAVTAMTTGRRYGGPEALGAGLVDLAVPDAEVLTKAIEIEWGGDGIRVDSVVPGPIEGTEGMTRLAPTPEAREIVRATVPAALPPTSGDDSG